MGIETDTNTRRSGGADSRKYAGEPIGQVNNGLEDRILQANGLRAGPDYRSDYTYTCTTGGSLSTPVVYCGRGGCDPVDSNVCRPTGGSCCRNGPQPFPPSA